MKILLIEGHEVETLSIGKINYTETSCPEVPNVPYDASGLSLAHFSTEIQPFVDHGKFFSVINMIQVQGHGADMEVLPCPHTSLVQRSSTKMNGGYWERENLLN